MGQVPNIKRIRVEDFDQKYQSLIEKLAYSLNTFMDDTIELLDGRLDFENIQQEVINVIIKTDGSGNLLENPTVRTTLNSAVIGATCIRALNNNDPGSYVVGTPWIDFTNNTNSIIIDNVENIPASSEFTLTLLLYGGN